jgi:hypothetical protein
MTWTRRDDVELRWKRSGQVVETAFPLNERNVNTLRVRCQSVPVAALFERMLLTERTLNGETGEAFVHFVDERLKAAYEQAHRRARGRRVR